MHGIELSTQPLPVVAVLFTRSDKFLQKEGKPARICAYAQDTDSAYGTGSGNCLQTCLFRFKGGQEVWRVGFHKQACAVVQGEAECLVDIAAKDRAFVCNCSLLAADRPDGLCEGCVFHKIAAFTFK